MGSGSKVSVWCYFLAASGGAKSCSSHYFKVIDKDMEVLEIGVRGCSSQMSCLGRVD